MKKILISALLSWAVVASANVENMPPDMSQEVNELTGQTNGFIATSTVVATWSNRWIATTTLTNGQINISNRVGYVETNYYSRFGGAISGNVQITGNVSVGGNVTIDQSLIVTNIYTTNINVTVTNMVVKGTVQGDGNSWSNFLLASDVITNSGINTGAYGKVIIDAGAISNDLDKVQADVIAVSNDTDKLQADMIVVSNGLGTVSNLGANTIANVSAISNDLDKAQADLIVASNNTTTVSNMLSSAGSTNLSVLINGQSSTGNVTFTIGTTNDFRAGKVKISEPSATNEPATQYYVDNKIVSNVVMSGIMLADNCFDVWGFVGVPRWGKAMTGTGIIEELVCNSCNGSPYFDLIKRSQGQSYTTRVSALAGIPMTVTTSTNTVFTLPYFTTGDVFGVLYTNASTATCGWANVKGRLYQ